MAKAGMIGDDLGIVVCEALGLDHKAVRRIVLDIQAGALVTAYIEHWGTQELVDIDWRASAGNIVIATLEETEEKG